MMIGLVDVSDRLTVGGVEGGDGSTVISKHKIATNNNHNCTTLSVWRNKFTRVTGGAWGFGRGVEGSEIGDPHPDPWGLPQPLEIPRSRISSQCSSSKVTPTASSWDCIFTSTT